MGDFEAWFGHPTMLGSSLLRALLTFSLWNGVSGKPQMPHFKWAQQKEKIFLSVMVRDLAKDSVSVEMKSPGDLSFHAKNKAGAEFSLDLPLREDVVESSMKFERLQRPDK